MWFMLKNVANITVRDKIVANSYVSTFFHVHYLQFFTMASSKHKKLNILL